jgi:prophage regulatory protein
MSNKQSNVKDSTPVAELLSFARLAVLRLARVEEVTGLKKTAIYDRMARKTFPASIKLGARSVGWRVGDIEAFLIDPAGYRAA